MKHLLIAALALALFPVPFAPAQTRTAPASQAPFSILIQPGLDIPLGASSDYFTVGGSLNLLGEYGLLPRPPLSILGGLDYHFSPIKAQQSLSFLAASAGVGASLELSPRFSLRGLLRGGYYFAAFNNSSDPGSDHNPFLSGGLGVDYLLTPAISLGVGASYKNYIGLYSGLAVTLGTSYYMRGREQRLARLQSASAQGLAGARIPKPGEGLALSDIRIERLFPVFYSYYDDHPIGGAELRNQGLDPVSNIKASLFIKQYMDSPKECAAPKELAGGERQKVDLYALFTDKVLEITEGTKVAADITLEYGLRGQQYRDTQTTTVTLLDRNAMTWDDDRRAAAFVTAKDPKVLGFSKNVASMIRDQGSRSLNASLLLAIGFHEAMDLYGISYVIDPKSSYIEFSEKKNQVDFLQFPRQTLEYRAGDCDDLSILYSALLESVGIETAFVTTPGHIFVAFSTGLTPEEAKGNYFNEAELISKEGRAWIPVEITERGSGFLRAWRQGAKEWRENEAAGKAGFFPVHAAWEKFKPVGLPGGDSRVALPSEDLIVRRHLEEVTRFIEQTVDPQAARLQQEISKSGDNPRPRNSLGVLYAKFGLFDKAEAEFKRVLARQEYFPALINLGNIKFLDREWMEALDYFQRAVKIVPANPAALLALSRAHYELENYGLARRTFQELRSADPPLAERFAYLDKSGEEGARAAEAANKGGVVWSEE